MIYKCASMSATTSELGEIVYDFEFDASDGSSLMLANIVNGCYELGALYNVELTPWVAEVDPQLIPTNNGE